MASGLLGCVAIWTIPGGAADPKKDMDDADTKAVMEFNAKVLQDTLSQQKLTRALKLRAATAARMIALTAQSGRGAQTAQLATIRDAALKIAEDIDADNIANAKAQAKDLLSIKPDENAKLGAIKVIDKKARLEDIMNQFASDRVGGLEIDNKLDDWDSKGLPDKLGEVAAVSNQLYVVFDAVKDHTADLKLGTQKQWDNFVDQAKKQAQELGDAARKDDKPATKKALASMNKACEDCHKVFKPKSN
jgi:cytochrome c556